MKKMYIYMMVAVVAIGLGVAIFGGNGKVDSSMNNSTSLNPTNSGASGNSASISSEMAACTPGADFGARQEGIKSVIIGYEEYKGKTFCKAESSATVTMNFGTAETHTFSYFDKGAYEMYIVTTTVTTMKTDPTNPTTKTREMHFIDGKLVA